jgi:hydroxyacylglutathione hydrolase
MGHEEEQMIDKTTPRFSTFRFNRELNCEQYELLYDQQIIQIDDVNIRCVATPGHTPGSLSFLINEQYLFVGDAMSLKKGKIRPFTSMFVMDMETHLKSIEKIKDIDKTKVIFTGHHGYVIL